MHERNIIDIRGIIKASNKVKFDEDCQTPVLDRAAELTDNYLQYCN